VASGGFADDNYKGAAWAFARYGNAWAQVGDKITGNDYTGAARQGSSVALSGDGSRLIMGGYQDNNRQGAVWTFGTDGCVWTQLGPKLVGTGGTSQAWQGYSVSLSADGNTAAGGWHMRTITSRVPRGYIRTRAARGRSKPGWWVHRQQERPDRATR
jgi:hypothetical protein